MSLKLLVSGGLAAVLLLAGVGIVPANVAASHIDWDARRAERAAEREARDAQREAERVAKEEAKSQPQCRHSVSLNLAKPEIRLKGNDIVMIPRVDVTIRTSGDFDAPEWEAAVDFEGAATFTSGNVTLPVGQIYGGSKIAASGLCGTDYKRSGFPLGDFVIGTLGQGISIADTLTGNVTLKAAVTGLSDTDEEHRQIKFEFEGFSTPDLGTWRTVR